MYSSIKANALEHHYSNLNFNNLSNRNNASSKYTLLIYMVGSDLEKSYYATKDLLEMEKAFHNTDINVIVETGGGGGNIDISRGGQRFIDFNIVQRHEIVNGIIHTIMNLSKQNMGAPQTLSDFIKWGISQFPAKKYSIILWDHGSGLNGFGKDIMFNNDILTPIELKEAFLTALSHTNKKFDLIGFDACIMSSLEIASRLQSFSHYMVTSEEVEPTWGWNYTAIIQNLSANPLQPGNLLGESIVDSYAKESKNFSALNKYSADKDITLSVIDLSKISMITTYLNNLISNLNSNINNIDSAINLSKSISITEHYGQSANGGTGIVDLSDLLSNINQHYPRLTDKIKTIQQLINLSVIYLFNGNARPNSHGLSIYAPLNRNEYSNTTALNVIDLNWINFLNIQKSMISNDKQPPIIKSIREGDTIKAHIFASDLANTYAKILTHSSRGHNLIYLQSIDPFLIDNKNYLQYKLHKLLVVCNERKCIPVSMRLEINKDKKFVFIPIRLESKEDSQKNGYFSLVYEIDKDGKFVFLGANHEMDPQNTIPKGAIALTENDKLYFQAYPAIVSFNPVGSIKEQEIFNPTLFEDGPLLVNNPENIEAHYVNFTSPFAISFIMCNFSDNCDKTRWYSFSNTTHIPKLPYNIEFGYDIENNNRSNNNFNTYVNPTYGFKLNYPLNWTKQIQYIYGNNSNSFNDLFSDPAVVSLYPYNSLSNEGNLHTQISISTNDWPFKDSPKYLFDLFNKTNNQKNILANNLKIISANSTTINEYPAFKFIFKYVSEPEQKLGIVKDSRIEQITSILMAHRMFTIDYSAYSSQFYLHLPIVNTIVNSFTPYKYDRTVQDINIENFAKINKTFDSYTNNLEIQNNTFLTYFDLLHGYKIKYPTYDTPIPFSFKNNPQAAKSEYFTLSPINTSPQNKDFVTLTITPISKYTYPQQIPFLDLTLNTFAFHSFDINEIISNVNQQLSIEKSILPNFTLIQESITTFKDKPALYVEYKYFNPIYKSMMQENYIFAIFKNHLFIFAYKSSAENYILYLPLLKKMLNSFVYIQ